jgi:uracil phosphoribosyltransferase
MSLYETACDDALFEQVCKSVAWEVIMYPEMVKLLQRIGTDGLVGAVVVTCGLGRVWEEVLRREGLHEHVKVIGGGRPSDGCVYGEIKTALVARLQEYHKMHVWAIGDGPLDLGMIEKADEAIVVVGEEKSRSRSMENKLLEAIEERGLRAQQLLLPNTVSPRGDPAKLPVIQITDDFLDTIHGYRSVIDDRILHATNTAAARLLMTPTRDARIQGGALRVAHHDIGRYLSIHYLGQMMGLEKYHIPHVTGHITEGFRLRYEQRTLIVALMRAGEPLAYGVNTALPQAAFLHAKRALDVTAEHLKGRYTVILADGVINTGTTVAMFIKHIRKISTRVQIIVVAGVTQANAVEDVLASILNEDRRTGLITLRMSDNKYTGVGGTDTGHRLFNTTFLE